MKIEDNDRLKLRCWIAGSITALPAVPALYAGLSNNVLWLKGNVEHTQK